MISCGKVAAIFVAFNPSMFFFDKLVRFRQELDLIVVYDNTEIRSSNVSLMENIEAGDFDDVIYITSGENVGIATALNISIKKCIESGVTHVFLFDQDSDVFSPNFFNVMVDELKEINGIDPYVVSLCPNIKDEGNPVGIYKWPTTNHKCPVLFSRKSFSDADEIYPLVAITSGSLFLSEIFNKIGYFEEQYFIDYVDTEYSLRLNCSGYKIKACQKAVLLHNLGAKTKKTLFGFTFYPTNHSAVRRYYIARNCVDVWRKYALSNPAWASFDLLASLYNAFRIFFFESDKLIKIKYACLGFFDGVNKKMGKKHFK